MDLRITRIVATLGFFAMVTGVAVAFAGPWGFVLGAVLLGAMTMYLWNLEVDAAPLPQPANQGQVGADQGQGRTADWN